MPTVDDSAHLASDAELITSVRAGDRQAFGDLYTRHASAAAALARQFARSPAEADDLVSEAFARVLDGLLEGKGPDTAFRAYLFTTVRNTAYDRTRRDKRLQFTDDIESHDQPAELDDPVIADLENGLVGRAFAGLPERWQTVLWHVQVEGQSPTEVGVLMGMAPNAVSSLAFRAREGLREAYLQAHLAETAAEQCRTTVDRLGAWTRGGLSKRERAQVDAHLQVCDRCPALAAELSEINTSLRGLLAPLLLGGAAAGYIATLGPIAPLVQLGTFTGGATVAGSTAVHGTAVAGKSLAGKAIAAKVFGGKAVLAMAKVGPWAPGAAVAGVAAAAAAVVASVVLTLAGGGPSAPAVAGSSQLAPTVATSSAVGGAGGGSGGTDNPGNGGPGNGGSENGGAGGVTDGGSTAAGSTVASPSTPVIPLPGPAGGGMPGTGTPTGPTTPAAGGTVTGPNGSPLPGDAGTAGPTDTLPAGLGTTDVANSDPAATDTATTNPAVTDPATTDTATTNPAATTPGATDAVTPPALPTDTSSSADPSSPAGSTPSTGSTGATPTTEPPTTEAPTTPRVTEPPVTEPPTTEPPTTEPPVTEPPTSAPVTPTPALLSVSASTVTDVVAGSTATVSVTVRNSGGTAAAAGQTVVLGVPDGVSIGVVLLGSPLRTPSAFAAAADPGCSQQTDTIRCALPAIDPQSSFDLTVVLDVSPEVADGDIDVMLNGVVADVRKIPLTVQSGYASVQLSSPGGLPLARNAVNAVRLVAVPKTGVRDAGPVIVGGADATVLAVHGDGGVCSVADGRVRCPAPAAAAGVTVDLALTDGATAPVMTAVDQRGRTVAAASSLTVADTGIGGYASVLLRAAAAGHLLRAGATDLVTLTGTTLNAGVVNAGPITVPVQLSSGVRIAPRAGADLPAGCVTADGAVTCTPADGADPSFSLPVQASSAASGPQLLADAVLPAGSADLTDATAPLTVDPARSGYDLITLTPTGALAAGTMGTLRLDTVVGDQVTEPGPVRIDREPAPGLLVTAAAGCEPVGAQYLCPPAGGGAPAPVLTVAVLPLAGPNPAPAPAELDGNRQQRVAGAVPVTPRSPGQRISLTGPFGGTTVGAPTLRCEKTGVDNRNGCPGGLTPVAASSATLTVPAGATVISAELTWAATAPAALPISSLDTVDVTIDGTRTGTVSGVLPTGVPGDVTGANPLTSGQLFQRVATADAQQLLAAGISPGSHTVSISNLAAKTTGARISAMGAWSLTVLWSTTGSADVGVLTDNRGQYSSSTRAGAVTTIEPAGDPVTSIYQTVWAPDPWAKKTLAIGGVPVSTAINGRHAGRLDGFELLHPTLPDGGLTGAITFTNRLTPDSTPNPDGLWIGPVLVITAR